MPQVVPHEDRTAIGLDENVLPRHALAIPHEGREIRLRMMRRGRGGAHEATLWL